MTQSSPTPGLLFVRSNRNEHLRDLIIDWMQRYPLPVFESDALLVHSNGIAQWFQRAMAASAAGISGGVEIALPARFMWPAYRAVLGDLPTHSVFDKSVLTWYLHDAFPRWVADGKLVGLEVFFARQSDPIQRHELAVMVADLFDQYQLYRPDWLARWAAGDDVVTQGDQWVAVDEDNRWQPVLWRLLKAELVGEDRADVHRRFVSACAALNAKPAGLPSRVVVFGLASMPPQVMDVLSSIARFTQVIIAVHSPSPLYWSDQWRGRSGSIEVHPWLDAWGRLGRDNARMLEAYEAQPLVVPADVELYERPGADSLLDRVHRSLFDLAPAPKLGPADASIQARSAYGPQREVEVLHDYLLGLFDADSSLRPEDVLVMVPAIDDYAPHIRSVFGRFDSTDRRFLPIALSDQSASSQSAWLSGLLALVAIPSSRFLLPDLLTLLGCAPIRDAYGLTESELPVIERWLDDAQVRWGLDTEQQAEISPAIGGRYTWAWGAQRMLLGYAAGSLCWQGIDGLDRVSGLSAQSAGRLALLIGKVAEMWHDAQQPRAAADWIAWLRAIPQQWLVPQSNSDLAAMRHAETALDRWQAELERAGVNPILDSAMAMGHWRSQLQQAEANSHFLQDAVQFATLMPMRAIPYRHLCVLGLNDQSYPRPNHAAGPDLMQFDYRPGDRARREDDRYLFLEAILSARDGLYLSYQGRSPVDDSARTPSVLWEQFMDFLKGGEAVVKPEQHPIHPYSHAYFTDQSPLSTYAIEWQGAAPAGAEEKPAPDDPEQSTVLRLSDVAALLKSPSAFFLRQRYQARYASSAVEKPTAEAFSMRELDGWQVHDLTLQGALAGVNGGLGADAALERTLDTLDRQGRFGIAPFSRRMRCELGDTWMPAISDYADRRAGPESRSMRAGQFDVAGGVFEFSDIEVTETVGGCFRFGFHASRLHPKSGGARRLSKLASPWVEHLCCQLDGPVHSRWWFADGAIQWGPIAASTAREYLVSLLRWALLAQQTPIPADASIAVPVIEAAGWSDTVRRAHENALANDASFARCWPNGADLEAAGDLFDACEALYGPIVAAFDS